MDAPVQLMTGEELFAMGDIGPCELVKGQIIRCHPATLQQGACISTVAYYLHCFIKNHRFGKVRVGEVGIYIKRNPDTIRAADVLFISNERYAQKKSQSYLDVAPELVVEVLSPAASLSEVMQKLREYFSIGVRLVWVADPQAKIVYAYRSTTDVREFAADDELPGDDVLPGFTVKVATLFED